MSIPRAVLDCDVIVSRVLYELLGRAAVDGKLLTLLWSDELLAEARHALIDSKGVPEAAAEHWVGHLRREFPAGRVDIGEASSDVDLSSLTRDPGDEHVCALAIAGQADLLFTFDRGYLQQPLQAHGIEVTRPDPFLAAAIERDAELFRRLLADQAAVWAAGSPSTNSSMLSIERGHRASRRRHEPCSPPKSRVGPRHDGRYAYVVCEI